MPRWVVGLARWALPRYWGWAPFSSSMVMAGGRAALVVVVGEASGAREILTNTFYSYGGALCGCRVSIYGGRASEQRGCLPPVRLGSSRNLIAWFPKRSPSWRVTLGVAGGEGAFALSTFHRSCHRSLGGGLGPGL